MPARGCAWSVLCPSGAVPVRGCALLRAVPAPAFPSAGTPSPGSAVFTQALPAGQAISPCAGAAEGRLLQGFGDCVADVGVFPSLNVSGREGGRAQLRPQPPAPLGGGTGSPPVGGCFSCRY